MNRISKLFEAHNQNILSVYFTAGHPSLESTTDIIIQLENEGVKLIEIGMPFSDPMADGPVIQRSSEIALENGMSLKLLFDQLKDIRSKVDIPLILMGYLNPVYQFGIEPFLAKCQEIGIDGVILPDLPMDEYLESYKALFQKYGVYNIFLITPETSASRLKLIDEQSEGFIYMVSSSATTGSKTDIAQSQEAYFKRIQAANLKSPRLIGFGISNRETFETACNYANGAIIGSAFVNAVSKETTDLKSNITEFTTQF